MIFFSFDSLKRSITISFAIVECQKLGLSFVGCLIIGTLSGIGSTLTKNLVDKLNGKETPSELSKPGW
jgi:hypothetical protein